ncbi:TPA: YbjN domain-containing protein, partial [Pseudomonas aeruginosa]
RRFGRLSQQGEFLVMEMDVIVAGGVSPANLRSHIELWDRLLQEFIAYLRDYSRLAAEQQGMAQDAGQPVDGEA